MYDSKFSFGPKCHRCVFFCSEYRLCMTCADNCWIWGGLFKGAFFPNGLYPSSSRSSPIVDLLRACYLSIPPWILTSFGRKERGYINPHFHQSLSPLCEGNPLDLDLGVLRVLLLVLPLIFLHRFCCFGGI